MNILKTLYVAILGVCALSGWLMHVMIQDTCQTCFWLRILWTISFAVGVLSYMRPSFEKAVVASLLAVSYVSFQKASFSFLKSSSVVITHYDLFGEGAFCHTPQILNIPLPTWSFLVSLLGLFLILTHILKNRRLSHAQ